LSLLRPGLQAAAAALGAGKATPAAHTYCSIDLTKESSSSWDREGAGAAANRAAGRDFRGHWQQAV